METNPRLNPETAEIPPEYIKHLENSRTMDFSQIHPLCPAYEVGRDLNGRRTILINAALVPKVIPRDIMIPYMLNRIDDLKFEPFSLIMNGVGLILGGDPPNFINASVYRQMPYVLRKNIKNLTIIQPTTFMRIIVAILRTFLSNKFFKKINYVYSISSLASIIHPVQAQVPPFYYRVNLTKPFPSFFNCTLPQQRHMEFEYVLNISLLDSKGKPYIPKNSTILNLSSESEGSETEQLGINEPEVQRIANSLSSYGNYAGELFPIREVDYIPLTLLNLFTCLVLMDWNATEAAQAAIQAATNERSFPYKPSHPQVKIDQDKEYYPSGLRTEFIFRQPPSKSALDTVLSQLEFNPLHIQPQDTPASLVASLVKRFLREIKGGLFTTEVADAIRLIWTDQNQSNPSTEHKYTSEDERITAIAEALLHHLPKSHLGTLQILVQIFYAVSAVHVNYTKMNATSAQVIFSPCLFGGMIGSNGFRDASAKNTYDQILIQKQQQIIQQQQDALKTETVSASASDSDLTGSSSQVKLIKAFGQMQSSANQLEWMHHFIEFLITHGILIFDKMRQIAEQEYMKSKEGKSSPSDIYDIPFPHPLSLTDLPNVFNLIIYRIRTAQYARSHLDITPKSSESEYYSPTLSSNSLLFKEIVSHSPTATIPAPPPPQKDQQSQLTNQLERKVIYCFAEAEITEFTSLPKPVLRSQVMRQFFHEKQNKQKQESSLQQQIEKEETIEVKKEESEEIKEDKTNKEGNKKDEQGNSETNKDSDENVEKKSE